VIEISPRAERVVDSRLTRRLVEIELSDADVPPRPDGAPGARQTVYFRVLATSPKTLRVELWDKGDYYGARRLSSADVKELLARRVALAAGALVRDLKIRRAAEVRALEQQKERLQQQREALAEALRWPAVTVEGKLALAAVGPGDMVLGGPGLAGQFRLRSGSRVGLGATWMVGAVSRASGSPALSWLEVAVTPEHAFRLTPSFDLAVGMTAAAAAVHLNRMSQVDDISAQADTWTTRAVARVMAEPHLGSHTRLSVGPELGIVARRIPVVDEAGDRHRLGGLWIGVSAGLVLDPGGRL